MAMATSPLVSPPSGPISRAASLGTESAVDGAVASPTSEQCSTHLSVAAVAFTQFTNGTGDVTEGTLTLPHCSLALIATCCQ